MHWLESEGCCKGVVIENLVFVVVWRCSKWSERDFHQGKNPHPCLGLLLGASLELSKYIQIRKNIDKKR
jgi:hypothetical protein